MRLNWELKNCCHHDQVVFPVTVSVCAVVILVLRRTVLLRPFKLVTLFLQEASHAIACRLTCGEVAGIQVHPDEGRKTTTRGGIYWCILPAGCNFSYPLLLCSFCYIFSSYLTWTLQFPNVFPDCILFNVKI
ncbi:uncharacterized protein LOC123204278 isoform X2 [Mangifera indica]|nr:uncharacterized protein LOC123204278 isoform X2 [Mangifera indica]